MKGIKGIHAALLAFILASVVLTGCNENCTVYNRYSYYEPVVTTMAEIRTETKFVPAKGINSAGKIYLKDNYLFINEPGKGIHFFDNSIPTLPVSVGFLNIPGNFDLAISGNTLYADSYTDLVAFDISDKSQVHEVSRLKDFFDPSPSSFFLDSGFVTDWLKIDEVDIYESACDVEIQPWGGLYYDKGIAFREGGNVNFANLAVSPGGGAGIGGSMARFTINGRHLYALEGSLINVLDISHEQKPDPKGTLELAWDIETIFPYGSNLFIGSQTGMYIVDVSKAPELNLVSVYQHLRSCDPVVVEGNLAYVTLRNGSECAGFLNQLEVIDLTDLASPKLLKTYPMTNPHGLGIDNGTLFICDGEAGLRIFDASDPLSIDQKPLAHLKQIHAFDVIPFQNVAILIGEDGLFQYHYADLENIRLLSVIPFAEDL